MDGRPRPGLPSGEECCKQSDPEQFGCPPVRRLLDVYGESEAPSTSGEGERKFTESFPLYSCSGHPTFGQHPQGITFRPDWTPSSIYSFLSFPYRESSLPQTNILHPAWPAIIPTLYIFSLSFLSLLFFSHTQQHFFGSGVQHHSFFFFFLLFFSPWKRYRNRPEASPDAEGRLGFLVFSKDRYRCTGLGAYVFFWVHTFFAAGMRCHITECTSTHIYF